MLGRTATTSSSLLHLYVQRFRKRKSISFAIVATLLLVTSIFVLFRSTSILSPFDFEPKRVELPPLRNPNTCTVPHSAPDGGDCQALTTLRRPTWACLSDMREEIPRFLSVYRHRPFKSNVGGMRIDHSFALWFVLRNVRPNTVIESGAFMGQSTWIMRKALPDARIISIDPSPPQQYLAGVEYYVKSKFRDFKLMDWKKMGINPDETVVFFDDHNSLMRRIFKDNKLGFYRFIGEDSYDYLTGDNMSLKWVCERKLKNKWRGSVPDNFGRINTRQSWEEHLRLGDKLDRTLDVYYEFPPIASSSLTGQKRYKPERASTPIVWDESEFHRLFGSFKKDEFAMYTHFTYVEVKRDAVSNSV